MISFTFGANPRPAHPQLPPANPQTYQKEYWKWLVFYFTRWEGSFMEKQQCTLLYTPGLSANIRQQSCNMFATFVP